jgi:hypothetical protein
MALFSLSRLLRLAFMFTVLIGEATARVKDSEERSVAILCSTITLPSLMLLWSMEITPSTHPSSSGLCPLVALSQVLFSIKDLIFSQLQ